MVKQARSKRWGKGAALTLVLIGVTPFMTGCHNVRTFASQCAYIIQSGYFDQHHTRAILMPGQRYNGNGVTARYVYCNARNYIVSNSNPLHDLDNPIQAKTKPSSNGDGTPVDVQLTAYFTVNQNHDAMLDFLPFCEKYNCFSPKDTSGNDTTNHSSSPGWNNMLAENFPNAITRATQHAMLQFPPNIWNDTSQWPKVSDAIAADFADQMQTQTGSTTPFFCGQGATQDKCPPIRFSIEHIDPTDNAIRDTYNQQVQQQYQQQLAAQQKRTNTALLNAARAKYGKFADYFLGLQDTIDHCTKNANCNVIIGGNGSSAIAVK
jgi:hypothetical protein